MSKRGKKKEDRKKGKYQKKEIALRSCKFKEYKQALSFLKMKYGYIWAQRSIRESSQNFSISPCNLLDNMPKNKIFMLLFFFPASPLTIFSLPLHKRMVYLLPHQTLSMRHYPKETSRITKDQLKITVIYKIFAIDTYNHIEAPQ